ncbi:MAG: RNA 2',3'-cyclic phosphodiesterase [Bacteriovoracaceae bacterium]
MQQIRLFTGLSLPKSLTYQIDSLRESIGGARWTPLENLHITLVFLGEIDKHIVSELEDDLCDINMTSMDLQLKGVNTFGPGHDPKVLYSSLTENENLLDLHSLILQKVKPYAQINKNKFHPHVTLARLKHVDTEALANFLIKHHDFKSKLFNVKEFHLYSSDLRPQGAQYNIENSYELY